MYCACSHERSQKRVQDFAYIAMVIGKQGGGPKTTESSGLYKDITTASRIRRWKSRTAVMYALAFLRHVCCATPIDQVKTKEGLVSGRSHNQHGTERLPKHSTERLPKHGGCIICLPSKCGIPINRCHGLVLHIAFMTTPSSVHAPSRFTTK